MIREVIDLENEFNRIKNIGWVKKSSRIGKVYDHGTDFSIKVKDLELLYDKIH